MTRTVPYLPLWIDDLLSHIRRTGEPTIATGARVILWCIAYYQRPVGTLPMDDVRLARWAGCSADEWTVIKPFLIDSWGMDRRKTRYVIRRVRDEVIRRARLVQSRSDAAKTRWAKRIDPHIDKPDANAYANALQVQCSPSPSLSPSSPASSKPSKRTPIAPASGGDFTSFWKAYPRKVGKAKAKIAWERAKPEIDSVLRALDWQRRSEQWTREEGQYIPHPATWIHQGRWDDEPIEIPNAPEAYKPDPPDPTREIPPDPERAKAARKLLATLSRQMGGETLAIEGDD